MKIAALWFLSLGVVAAVSAALTFAVMRKTASTGEGLPRALPWSMGAQSLEAGPDESTYARTAFINLPASCDVFSPGRAVLFADEVIITRVPNTQRDVNAELRGGVHLRYTLLHD